MWSGPPCRCARHGHVLAWTALHFLAPAALYPRHHPNRWACCALVATSLYYHGTHTWSARALDVAMVRLVGLLAVVQAAGMPVPRARLCAALALGAGAVWIHHADATHVGPRGPLRLEAHAAVHALGAAALAALAC